jgi:HK97 family phage prohead protease
MKAVYKTSELSASTDGQFEFVASDETVDRYGDIVRVAGWDLSPYKRNPIVLFQHQASNPVGISTKTWIDGKQLLARIKLAAEGTSPFIDTLRKLLTQKIIRAVSVGFMPTKEYKQIIDDKTGFATGLEFNGQELLEISLVSVPANPAALQMAKSLHIPETHIQRVFSPVGPDASVKMAQNRAAMEIVKVRRFGHIS